MSADIPAGDERSPYPLVFIGPMAAGKSKIGRRAARGLGVPFVDTDKLIVARYGPISEIFAREGEDYFRVIERGIVADALSQTGVVSLGGGAVLDSATQADLAEHTVVYLSVNARAASRRIGGKKRPLLSGGIADWERIFTQRRPIYEALSTIHFDTSHRPISTIADEIVTWVRKRS
ncbi:shikimate kinase [Cryobacterium roopkundense]|uniref:Shikimate kinase n=1 Tax=Cryobacterium roopkundense TaxID=1001240 RepID=A0A099JM39_9MICO|nr:shikimate kinase [Cryobacterium roopkundense]KGJ79185.1 shikimate kinase [Cryobacterium roopkundense]MBB5641378.1 shikimate kinase [Cryobacterium roopkundense]